MKHSERFSNAVTKLYNAFHKGELNANDCSACAVGNICDNSAEWAYLITHHGSGFPTLDKDAYELGVDFIKKTGYSAREILNIEKIFLDATNWHVKGLTPKFTKEEKFKGLCEVVEYLCELDGIPNVMDYSKLFETENTEPKHKLEEVFI